MDQVDFLVIGAGIAGLSAAARLARHGTVVVCEAEDAPGFHSSGRSAAFAHFDMDSPVVRSLTAASMPLLEEPAAHTHPALFIAMAGQEEALVRVEANYREWNNAVERIDAEHACAIVPVLWESAIIGAVLDPEAKKLDAHAMLEGHRKALTANGGKLVTGAAVASLRHEAGRWLVGTSCGAWSARVVVNAAGAWVDQIAAMAGVSPLGIRPLRRTVITFEAPQGMDVSSWPFTKTVGPGFYMEPEGRGRILACPMDEHESEPCDAQPEEEDVALTAWRVEQATILDIRRIASKWAGLRSFAPDRQPVGGFDPDAPGFFWLAGQGGFGLQTSPAVALAVEALATGSTWPDELASVGVTAETLSPRRFTSAI
ncbi:MAG: FAD-dependent oxidoreductase [Erythrobacter sp.]